MLEALHVLSILLGATGMALALSHALEWPGKQRLSREAYFTVQTIYYPGFTIGGAVGEAGAMIATLILLLAMPWAGTAAWLVFGAFLCQVAMHAVFWIVTQPVNRVWLADQKLGRAGSMFFASGKAAAVTLDWTVLRDRWEGSHAVRAVLATLAVLALATAAVV